ncbi:CapA family protein [Planosporangium sp. 12N6]|uniref:CapA family protein n=1 Tax=Planosporangium spinosum TaxID=3402278 RepID=UPI003CF030CE
MAAAPPPRERRRRRPAFTIVGLVVLATGLAAGTTVVAARSVTVSAGTRWATPSPTPVGPDGAAAPLPTAAPVVAGDVETISLSATGDIIMGAAPGGLPPDGARNFFADVKTALHADLQMGNLEQPLTNDTGVSKCPPAPTAGPAAGAKPTCYAFRSPPGYAAVLRDAGFRVLNLANNHAYDFGPEGNRQTRTALAAAGLADTGAPGQITVVEVKGVKVAVLGFSSYAWSANVVDIAGGAALVKQAKNRADLVVVQMHVGAEGPDQTHVRPGTEMFLGENRGDPYRFAHAVVDAGADLVIGHGPHVMRAMEFYRGRLIAYSLGNFAGYRALNINGLPGVGGVLKVTLRADGTYVEGSLVPTRMVAPGLPALDPAKRALGLVRELGTADLPDSAARIGDDGAITPRS